jgi:hypothetical protein
MIVMIAEFSGSNDEVGERAMSASASITRYLTRVIA